MTGLTVVVLIVFVLGGILTALVCKQTRRIATTARDIATDALADADGTRRASEEALRRVADTEATRDRAAAHPATQAVRLPESWAALPVKRHSYGTSTGTPVVFGTTWQDGLNGDRTNGPSTQRIPRAGGTR